MRDGGGGTISYLDSMIFLWNYSVLVRTLQGTNRIYVYICVCHFSVCVCV